MKMIVIVMVILVYWFLLGIGINLLLQDELIVSANVGNNSLNKFDATNLNMTTLNPSNDGNPTLKTFVSTLKIMFGFSTPIAIGIPSLVAQIISFTNWFLFLIGGLAVYRLANPFAAP